MSDLLDRLRIGIPWTPKITPKIRNEACRSMREAADEIVELRAKVRISEERLPSPRPRAAYAAPDLRPHQRFECEP